MGIPLNESCSFFHASEVKGAMGGHKKTFIQSDPIPCRFSSRTGGRSVVAGKQGEDVVADLYVSAEVFAETNDEVEIEGRPGRFIVAGRSTPSIKAYNKYPLKEKR